MASKQATGVQGELTNNWETVGSAHATGSAFIDGEIQTAARLASMLDDASDIETVLQRANGFFAAVVFRDDDVHLCTDRIASHSLFYGQMSDNAYFSDNAAWVRERVGDESYDPVSEVEYLTSGYVTGRDTLSPNVSQLLSGEHIKITDEPTVTRSRWFNFPETRDPDQQTGTASSRLLENSSYESETGLLEALDQTYVNAYERLIEYADGRPIVVSLSAGHDSRLNLLMLSRLDYDNLIALTYAEKDKETTICKRIVDDLGAQWIYAGETHEQWFEWYNSSKYEQFQKESGFLHRIPSLGTVMGVKTAHEADILPDNAVFVTGDGVISTGEHIMAPVAEAEEITANEVYERIASTHYKFWDWNDDVADALQNRVESGLGDAKIETPEDAIQALERWDWQERQSKFIPRYYVYEFWDYDWWLPLWDAEVVNFWQHLPLAKKFDKQIHRNYVELLHREVADVNDGRVESSVWSGASLGQRLKNTLRNTKLDPTGTAVDKFARKVYFKHVDPLDYDERADFGIMMRQQFEELQTGLLTVHAFQAMEVLDRVSFDPPRNHDLPDSMAEILKEANETNG